MGNEVSRPMGADDGSPQNSGVVPPTTPSTPTGGFSRRAQSFNARSPSPSVASPAPNQRRTSSSGSLSSGGGGGGNPNANPRKERTIQRMDKAIRRRVRGGITYNMKLLIRGAKGTGKTSLFQRLKGEPIPETHESTPQLQSATINWSFRQNLEENVKCEVWDVVDRGFVPVAADGEAEGSQNAAGRGSSVTVEHGGLQSGGGLSAEVSAAAVAAAAVMQNGTHSVAIVDASTVDVYHEAHGVIFLLDITKWDTLEYVKQQLDNVPVHIPTLVLGNFRDQGAQRKIFKEDIQELLYGSSDRPQHQQWRRPIELLYFECSLQNCYGLKSLHQYFGIPFLQLKLATIRQQMRIVEGEFAHLKHDVQATISEQRYAEYVEHIRATGSDIRTGRRGSGNGNTPPATSRNGSIKLPSRESLSQVDDERLTNGDMASQVSADDDVSVVSKENGAGTPPKTAVAESTTNTVSTETAHQDQQQEVGSTLDTEDLPARSSSAVIQAAAPLMFEHKESVTSIPDEVEESVERTEEKPALPAKRSTNASATASGRSRKLSVEEVIHLEDFQVPKARTSDLDHFYSEDESDEDVGEYDDEDVVVAPVDGAMKTSLSGVYHKQRFLDSDSSDSDENETGGAQSRRKEKGARRGSPRRTATKQASGASQQVPRPPMSPPHPPTSSSPSNQRSRPGSPARQQSSSPVKDVPRDTSSKQRHPSPSSDDTGAVSPTPPVAPPTSPLASSIRHSSPRNKSDTSTSALQPTSLTQDDRKHGSSSGEEPELTGTEDAVRPMEIDDEKSEKKLFKQESPRNSDSTVSPGVAAGADVTPPASETNDKSDVAEATESPNVSATPYFSGSSSSNEVALIDADSSAYDDSEEVIRAPTHDEANDLAEKDDELFDENGSTADKSKAFLVGKGDERDEGVGDAAILNDVPVVKEAISQHSLLSTSSRRSEVLKSYDESGESSTSGAAGLSLTSLQATLPMPESSSSSGGVLSASVDTQMGHFHRRNMEESSDLLSLTSLQASLPIPGQVVAPISSMHQTTSERQDYRRESGISTMETKALQLSDLQESPVKASSSSSLVPDFTTVVPSNDLEAFLNESDSDSEDASPSYAAPSGKVKQSLQTRRAMVESSEDDDDEGEEQDRFASYNITKKSRSERRRQQKEDLRQLNAALETAAVENDPFAAASVGVAAAESSFGTSDVMEAIRKAQEEAMRMIPSAPAATGDEGDADSNSSRRRHKHKKEHKHKKREGSEKSSKASRRKSGSSSRSKKRRPHVEDDLA